MTLATHVFNADDEYGRQCALDRFNILDTEVESEFEEITSLVSTCLNAPIAGVSLIDKARLWYKSLQGADVKEAVRDTTFCDHTIRSTRPLNVGNMLDDVRFASNPYVIGPPYIRSYLGVPLVTPDGYAIGALCAMDRRVRTFTREQVRMLKGFSALVLNELELRAMANEDQLTGLSSRRSFFEAMDKVIEQSAPAALMCLDLDHFKSINDTFGHPAGDDVLKSVGAVLRDHCPPGGAAGRLGGEEFGLLVLLSEGHTGSKQAEDVRRAIEKLSFPNMPDVKVTASIGVAYAASHSDSGTWMASADQVLYRAKHDGRNRVRFA